MLQVQKITHKPQQSSFLACPGCYCIWDFFPLKLSSQPAFFSPAAYRFLNITAISCKITPKIATNHNSADNKTGFLLGLASERISVNFLVLRGFQAFTVQVWTILSTTKLKKNKKSRVMNYKMRVVLLTSF